MAQNQLIEIADYHPSPAQERTPPHNEAVEMALLAAILHNNKVYEKVSDFLKPEHFASELHGRIYRDMVILIDQGKIADPRTLHPLFMSYEQVKNSNGGIAQNYLMELATHLVAVRNAEVYGKMVFDLYLRRQLIDISVKVIDQAYSYEIDPNAEEQIEIAAAKIFELCDKGIAEGGLRDFSTGIPEAAKMLENAMKRPDGLSGLATGLIDFDKIMGGLQKSDLVILAGRPSMGKTSLATNIAFHVANGKHATAFFSLEMNREQLTTRILSDLSQISSSNMRRGNISVEDFDKIMEVGNKLNDLPLYIDDTGGMNVSQIRNRARSLDRKIKGGLQLIVVDYLQLMTSPKKIENRVNLISEITQGLKFIAKELNVPVIALSQLNRSVENRENKRPHLADLRDSGTIEQDADIVVFVYREQYYLEKNKPDPDNENEYAEWERKMERSNNLAELIVAKQRHGPLGTAVVHFDGETTKFSSTTNESSRDYRSMMESAE